MKLSTRSRYGVRLLIELAMNYSSRSMQLNVISKNQNISEKYLGQLVIQLKSAGFINSERGKNGGYFLARPPKDINLREIVEKLEGSLCLVDCVEDDNLCNRADFCVTRDIWSDISRNIALFLEGITLQDLVDRTLKARKNFLYEI